MKRQNRVGSPGGGRRSTPLVVAARARQRGMTTLGFIILACFVGLCAFAVIRLTPVYLNYLKVAGVVNGALLYPTAGKDFSEAVAAFQSQKSQKAAKARATPTMLKTPKASTLRTWTAS